LSRHCQHKSRAEPGFVSSDQLKAEAFSLGYGRARALQDRSHREKPTDHFLPGTRLFLAWARRLEHG